MRTAFHVRSGEAFTVKLTPNGVLPNSTIGFHQGSHFLQQPELQLPDERSARAARAPAAGNHFSQAIFVGDVLGAKTMLGFVGSLHTSSLKC